MQGDWKGRGLQEKRGFRWGRSLLEGSGVQGKKGSLERGVWEWRGPGAESCRGRMGRGA